MGDHMEVTYIGHACFVVKFSTGLSVCFDPYATGSVPGLSDADVIADEVFCSHSHADHNARGAVGKPEVRYDGPAPEVKIISSFHDEVRGAKRGTNNITKITSGNETVVHMGDIGCELTDAQLAEIKGCDLLLIPVGGFFTVGCREAFELCRQISPKAVVPMHFRGDTFGYDVISGREEFVELVRNSGDRKIINAGSVFGDIPDESSLLLMEPLRIL